MILSKTTSSLSIWKILGALLWRKRSWRSSHTSWIVVEKITLSCVSELWIQDRIISLYFFHEAYSSGLSMADRILMVPSMKPSLDLAFKEIVTKNWNFKLFFCSAKMSHNVKFPLWFSQVILTWLTKLTRCQRYADSTEVLVQVPMTTTDWIHIPAWLLGPHISLDKKSTKS